MNFINLKSLMYRSKIVYALGILLTVVTFSACSDNPNSPTLVSIAVTPVNPSIAMATTQQFTATGTFSDATTQDITSSVVWASSDTNVATINSSGLATSVAPGVSTISATLDLISVETTLTITSATLVSIAVTPANPTVPSGFTQQFTATGTYSDATTQDITSSVAWASSDTNVATINATNGLAATVAEGTTNITASLSGIMSPAQTLMATSAILESIAVTTLPAGVSLIAAKGGKQQFKATGTYSDGTQLDITSYVTWTSDDINVTFGVGNGLATCNDTVAVPGITIIATAPGSFISGSTSLDVVVLSSITITSAGDATNVAVGNTLQFTAIGTYADSRTQDLTSSYSAWTSSSPVRVTINANTGLATGHQTGSANIRAAYAGVTSNLFSLTVSTLKMFVTTSVWNGRLGQGGAPITLAAIDALCMADSNKPAGGETYKAMFASTTAGQIRIACTTPSCSGGATENTNWVMSPNTDYYRADGTTLIGTTNSGGVFPLNNGQTLSNSISVDVNEWSWTGLSGYVESNGGANNGAWVTGTNCSDWTSSVSVPPFGTEGHGTGTTGNSNGDNGAIAGWLQNCDDLLHLVCVEQ